MFYLFPFAIMFSQSKKKISFRFSFSDFSDRNRIFRISSYLDFSYCKTENVISPLFLRCYPICKFSYKSGALKFEHVLLLSRRVFRVLSYPNWPWRRVPLWIALACTRTLYVIALCNGYVICRPFEFADESISVNSLKSKWTMQA